jgi:hypothetical protein
MTSFLQNFARRAGLILFLLEGCDPTGSLLLPPGAERFVPPRVYEQWWHLTEECSGVTGSFAAVSWYRVPGTTIPLAEGTLVNGRWDARANRIVLAGNDELAGDLVRHEMLHALIRAPGHPRAEFISRCGGVVVCTQQCISDAGPAPQPNPLAVSVAPTALQIGVEVAPRAPGSSINDGNFMMIVTARNPSSSPLIVQLPVSGDGGPPASFSYDLISSSRGQSYDMRAEVPEDSWFAPSEEKRFIFDFHWRRGVAEAALQVGLFRGPAVSPQTFRLIVTFGLLVNIVVFATLLTGIWGPIPRPTF